MAPPPVNLKQSSTSAAQTITTTAGHEARLLVRETLRISAGLASSPADFSPSSLPLLAHDATRKLGLVEDEFVASSLRLICCEELDGRRWQYVAETEPSGRSFKKGSFRALGLLSPQVPYEVGFLLFLSLFLGFWLCGIWILKSWLCSLLTLLLMISVIFYCIWGI